MLPRYLQEESESAGRQLPEMRRVVYCVYRTRIRAKVPDSQLVVQTPICFRKQGDPNI